MAQQTPYIGSKISLISKLDIRYEGVLYTVDSKESTIALSKVRSFGTEDRSAAHVVPPQDDVYDYIIFKANDIKDLIVCETPKPQAPGLPYDPAILSASQPTTAPSGAPGSAPAPRSASPEAVLPQQPQQVRPNNRQGQQGPRQQQGYNNQNRQQGERYYNNSRNNQNGAPVNQGQAPRGRAPYGVRNKLKFDSDYDFQKANEQFAETLDGVVQALATSKLDEESVPDDDSDAGVTDDAPLEPFYDKSKSFFDSISCEALEKEAGKNTRPDWRKERLTNQETFGQQSVRNYGYHRRGQNTRGGYNGNYRGNNPRGGYRGNNGGYHRNNYNGGNNGGNYNNAGNYNNRQNDGQNRSRNYNNRRDNDQQQPRSQAAGGERGQQNRY
uniref:FFD domain-containing protein n=1 Tax=Panagrellus redivivus TaxID=6233 RepID=A0A7E4V0A1_PANRE